MYLDYLPIQEFLPLLPLLFQLIVFRLCLCFDLKQQHQEAVLETPLSFSAYYFSFKSIVEQVILTVTFTLDQSFVMESI